jgi:hypothetical protein
VVHGDVRVVARGIACRHGTFRWDHILRKTTEATGRGESHGENQHQQ